MNVSIEAVDSKEAFLAALDSGEIDIIISDHLLPQFDFIKTLLM